MGEKVSLDINRPMPHDLKKRLTINNITCTNEDGLHVLENVSFEAFGGEVLGVAGISGSGQKELLEAIAGLTKLHQEVSFSTHQKEKILTLPNMMRRRLMNLVSAIHLFRKTVLVWDLSAPWV